MDSHAIDVLGIAGYTLMSRAAEAALSVLRDEWPAARKLVVVCGFGNNAGDGYVLARLAMQAGLRVTLLSVADANTLMGDAGKAWREFTAAGGQVQSWDAADLHGADVIVDAMFGTGLSRPLDARLCECVQAINHAAAPVLALDVPSGLHADQGVVMGAAVQAACTVSFVGLKQGFYLGAGPDHAGRVKFADLGIPAFVAEQAGAVATRLDQRLVERALPGRPRTSHKGRNGHVLIVGGGLGMAGAVLLTGKACLRVGAGLVTVATRPEHAAMLAAGCPELMCRGVLQDEALRQLINTADVIAIGPGLGQDAWASQLLSVVLAADKPLVVDADALNLLAADQTMRRTGQDKTRPDKTSQGTTRQGITSTAGWILTPHPGEAARLLDTNNVAVQADRLGSARQLQQRYGGVVVLKGAGTVICAADELPAICDRGNPGMAAPGMGDVLTGVIAAVLAQGADLLSAARVAVFMHASAGDLAARDGERGLMASDLFAHLRHCANP